MQSPKTADLIPILIHNSQHSNIRLTTNKSRELSAGRRSWQALSWARYVTRYGRARRDFVARVEETQTGDAEKA